MLTSEPSEDLQVSHTGLFWTAACVMAAMEAWYPSWEATTVTIVLTATAASGHVALSTLDPRMALTRVRSSQGFIAASIPLISFQPSAPA